MVVVSDQSPEKNKNSHETDNEALPHITGSFAQKVIKISIANICSNIGWNSIGSVSLDILTEIVEQWIAAAGRYSLNYSNHAGRSEVTLADLLLALENRLHFSLPELQDYVQNVAPHPISIKVPRFPASIRPSNRLVFAADYECPFGEDVVIGYAHSSDDEVDEDEKEQSANKEETEKKDDISTNGTSSVDEKKKKFPIKRSDYYDKWLPPFPSDSAAAPDKLTANGINENSNTNPASDYKVSEIEAAPPLSAVTLNKDGSIVSLNGKDGKGPEPTLPPLDSDIDSESDSDESTHNLSREETSEPRVEKISIRKSDLGKMNKKKLSSISPSEKGARGKASRANKKPHTAGPVLSIKVSGIISGTPTASPKLSSETPSVLTPAMEERMDSIIDSVIASVAANSPSPPPPSSQSTNSSSKWSKESSKNASNKKPKITSKEFVSDSDDSDDDQEEMDPEQQLLQSLALPPSSLQSPVSAKESSGKKRSKKKQKEQASQKSQQSKLQQQPQGKNDQSCMSNQEPVVPQGETATRTSCSPLSPSTAAPTSAPTISSSLVANSHTITSTAGSPVSSNIVNSPSSPAKIDHSASVTVASPSKGARKMYPEDIKEAAKILLDISETPVVSASPFNLGQSFGNLSSQSPPAPKIVTLAARKAFTSDVRSVPSSPSEDESTSNSKIASLSDDPKKRKKDKKNKKDKKKKREDKEKDRKEKKKKPSSPSEFKVNIKLLKEKDKKQLSDTETMPLTQSTSSKKDLTSSKEAKSSSCILITETIATMSSDGKKGAASNAHSPGVKSGTKSTGKSKPNALLTAAAKKAAVTTETVAETEESWSCGTCGKKDDPSGGTEMIGCDGPCEGWFHWSCVGVKEAPAEDDDWYCPTCEAKKVKEAKQTSNASNKKRKADPPKAEDESERKRKRKKKPG